MSLFQSNLRNQIRKLPKISKFVKIIQYCSILFNIIQSCPYSEARAGEAAVREERQRQAAREPGALDADEGAEARDTVLRGT